MAGSRLVKKRDYTIIVGRAATPYIPAYCESKTVVVGTRYIPGRGASCGYRPTLIVRNGEYEIINLYSCEDAQPGRVEPIYRTEKKCYPAQPATEGIPTKLIGKNDNQWGDGARSIAEIKANESISFTVPNKPKAIIVGLDSIGKGYQKGALAHGILIRDTSIAVIERGIEKKEIAVNLRNITVSRTSDLVIYAAGEETLAEYPAGYSEELYLYASLYSYQDYIEDPKITKSSVTVISEFEITTSAVAVVGGTTQASGISSFSMQADTRVGVGVRQSCSGEAIAIHYENNSFHSPKISYANIRLALTGAISEKASSLFASGRFPKYVCTGLIDASEPVEITSMGVGAGVSGRAFIQSGGVMTGSGSQPVSFKASDSDWAAIQMKVKFRYSAVGYFSTIASDNNQMLEFVKVKDSFNLESSIVFAFAENIRAGGFFDVYALLDMHFQEGVRAVDSLTFSQFINLIFDEGVLVSGALDSQKLEAIQYAVNAASGAISRYSNFDFKQFARLGNTTYALGPNGIYELGYDTDNNELISAMIDFGASDFGSAQGKRVSSVYAGLLTDGTAYIRLAGDNGEQQVYQLNQYGNEGRAKTAKGIIAKHWRLQLELVDASSIELDSIEIELGASQRRLTGRR